MPEALPADVRREAEAFFERYRAAFERQDAPGIAELYAYPAHVTSDTGRVDLFAASSKEVWTAKVYELLGLYRDVGFRAVKIVDLTTHKLSSLLFTANVRWALHDAKGELLYDFDTIYTVGRFDPGLRIVSVVAHDEYPRYLACLARKERGKPAR